MATELAAALPQVEAPIIATVEYDLNVSYPIAAPAERPCLLIVVDAGNIQSCWLYFDHNGTNIEAEISLSQFYGS